ncbi:MAG: NTP transferase domain-containing protein [Planctomycetota bacterium]|nr:NTP transferase domain-containing protein [Planctomycetota bacterium]
MARRCRREVRAYAMAFAAIILAAGQGKRMKSDLPKVLHPLKGKPLVNWVIESARAAGADKVVVVVGYGREQVIQALPAGVGTAVQDKQLGTGHAARSAEAALGGYAGPVAILSGDVPLMPAKAIADLAADQAAKGAAVSLLTAMVPGEHGYGRIVRGGSGAVQRIVENKDATPEEKKIGEINTGTYVFGPGELFPALAGLTNKNAQGEYYLTDTIAHFVGQGKKVSAVVAPRVEDCLGVNTPEELAAAEQAMGSR